MSKIFQKRNSNFYKIKTPLVSMCFNVFPDICIEPISVNTTLCESVGSKRVYPILWSNNRVTLVNLVERDMLDFDVIWVIVLLHACFTSIGCCTMVVNFNFLIHLS